MMSKERKRVRLTKKARKLWRKVWMAKAMGALKDPSKLKKKEIEDSSSEEEEVKRTCYSQIALRPKSLTHTIYTSFISVLTLVQICKTVITLGFEYQY